MRDSDGLRRVSDVLADYMDKFGEPFPWPWGVGDLDEAEALAKTCIKMDKAYVFEYDDDKIY